MGLTGRSGMGRGNLKEVRDELRDPRRGLGQVEGPLSWSGMGR